MYKHFVILLIGLSLCPILAFADTTGPNGESLSLSITPIANTTKFTVVLSIDTTGSGFTLGGSYLDSVGIKISSQVLGMTSSLVSVTDNNTPVTNGLFQTYFNSGLSANGCTGSGSGFVCVKAPTVGAFDQTPGVMTFTLIIDTGSAGANAVDTVKALYLDSSGSKVGAINSLYVPPTSTNMPEGGSAEMLVFAGLTLAVVQWRQRRKPS